MNLSSLEIKIISFQKEYERMVINLLEELHQYLVHIDPLKRLRIEPGYGEMELKKILKEIELMEGIFYLATIGDEVAGFVTATIHRQTSEDLMQAVPSSVGRVTKLYISPLHRQKGLGTTLLKKAEEYARSKECDAMKIEVFAPNEPARSFYGKHNYQPLEIDQIKVF